MTTQYRAYSTITGYTPHPDLVSMHSSAPDAWRRLYWERVEELEGEDVTTHELGYRSAVCAEGIVNGPTPGYAGPNDLGMAYVVEAVEIEPESAA